MIDKIVLCVLSKNNLGSQILTNLCGLLLNFFASKNNCRVNFKVTLLQHFVVCFMPSLFGGRQTHTTHGYVFSLQAMGVRPDGLGSTGIAVAWAGSRKLD